MLLIYATRLGHQQRHVLVNFLLYSIIGVLKLVGYFTVKPYLPVSMGSITRLILSQSGLVHQSPLRPPPST